MSSVYTNLDDVFEESQRVSDGRFEYSKLNVEQTFRPFQLDKGTSQDVIFLTENVLARYEHTVHTFTSAGKDRYTQVACLRDDCPLCEVATKGSPVGPARLLTYFNVMAVGPYSVYDYEAKGVKEFVNPNLILIATSQTLEYIKEFRGKNKGKLRGLELTMKRTTKDKTPRVGDIVYPSGTKYTDEEILEINPDAFDDVYDYNRITTSLEHNDAVNYVKLVMGNKAPRANSNAGQARRAQTPEQKISWTE